MLPWLASNRSALVSEFFLLRPPSLTHGLPCGPVLHSLRRVNTSDLEAVKAAVTEKTKLVIMESPTNPRQLISDIRVGGDCASLDFSCSPSYRPSVTPRLHRIAAVFPPSLVVIVMPSVPVCALVAVPSRQAIADIAHSVGAILAVDNSIMSPFLSRPLALGAGEAA